LPSFCLMFLCFCPRCVFVLSYVFVFICLRCVLCFCVYWSSFCLMFLSVTIRSDDQAKCTNINKTVKFTNINKSTKSTTGTCFIQKQGKHLLFSPSPLRLNIFRLFVILSLTQLYRYTPEIFLFTTATFKYTYRYIFWMKQVPLSICTEYKIKCRFGQ
jgi:hypothetical protein